MAAKILLTEDHLRQIEVVAGYGLTEAAIAHVLGLDPRTFRRRKRDEAAVLSALEKGKAKAEHQVGQALFTKATSGDLGAIVWWEKTRAGRRDTTHHQHTGGEPGDAGIKTAGDFAQRDREAREWFLRELGTMERRMAAARDLPLPGSPVEPDPDDTATDNADENGRPVRRGYLRGNG
jgi:hypothetical protein